MTLFRDLLYINSLIIMVCLWNDWQDGMDALPLRGNISFNLNVGNAIKKWGVGMEKIPNTFKVEKNERTSEPPCLSAIPEASSTDRGVRRAQ